LHPGQKLQMGDEDSVDRNPLTDTQLPELHGNDYPFINKVAVALLIGVFVLPIVGVGLEKMAQLTSCKKYRERGHPGTWVVVLLVVSYALLVPGLIGDLFSFNIEANLLVMKIGLGPDGGPNKVEPTTESMFGLIGLLHHTGCDLGVVLVLTYAVLIPVAKIILLLAGEFLRGKSVRKSMRCVQVVQNISKWACPDMFAYVLLMHLIRGLEHPMILLAAGRLDLGFTCFSIFCVGSTVAAIGLETPDKEKGFWKRLAQLLGPTGLMIVLVPLEIAFVCLLVYGMQQPAMSLRVDIDPLYSTHGGPIDIKLKSIVDSLGIVKMCHADVSLIAAMRKLVFWIGCGEVNSFIGFVLIAVFAVAFTCLDMLFLLFTAVCLLTHSGRKFSPLKLCWILKKLSMLDVTIMGVVVVTLCMAMYRDKGVIVFMGHGLWLLLGAEIIHYFCYYAVKGAMQTFEPEANFAQKTTMWDNDSSDSSLDSGSNSSESDNDDSQNGVD